MPHLLLLLPATTYRAAAFLSAARRLALQVTIGSNRAPAEPGESGSSALLLDFHDPESCAFAAEQLARSHRIDAVVGVDEVTVEVAAAIAARLGLTHNPVDAVAATRNKYKMRERLRLGGVPVPAYGLFSRDQDPVTLAPQVGYPCVIKPTILSSSCGVIRADNPESFIKAFRRVAVLLGRLGLDAFGDQAREILVEDFIPGEEVALEALLVDGELRPLALFDKPEPLDGPYFEETIYVTPSRHPSATQAQVLDCAASAAKALGLHEGPIHGEFRLNARGVRVIEVAARAIGGQCSRTLQFAAGMSLEELILRQACRLEIPSHERTGLAAGVMMLPIPRAGVFRELRGQHRASAVPGIEELVVAAQPGERLVPLPEGTRYLGFLFARAETPEAVERALREAHGHLELMMDGHDGPELLPPAACGAGKRVITF